MKGDGDGWVECDQGHRHWGRFGAAGLLAHRRGGRGPEVLLQHRAEWSHHGDTWGLLGGARNSGETAVAAAIREAGEEGGISPADIRIHGRYDERHGGWAYATILATAGEDTDARPTGGESTAVEWIGVEQVADHPLHPGFAAAWPNLRDALVPLHVVVDAANVVGSRPNGWWRDRAGAARRLVEACARLASAGVGADQLPPAAPACLGALSRLWPRLTVVVEGSARGVADEPTDEPTDPAVHVHAATGSGDDSIVGVAADTAASGDLVLVVTADRALRERCTSVGASVTGPRWLTNLLDRAGT